MIYLYLSVHGPTFDCVFIGTLEPWQQQEVDKVCQRQEVVAEKTGCKKRDKQQRILFEYFSIQIKWHLNIFALPHATRF